MFLRMTSEGSEAWRIFQSIPSCLQESLSLKKLEKLGKINIFVT